jgi:uncharacterized Zn ribbon protein
MICFKCNCGRDAAFFREEFPCDHCEELNLLEYNICPECGWMWRSVNGKPLEDSQLNIKDLGDFASVVLGQGNEMTEEEINIMENINEQLERIAKIDDGEATMSDYINKCLRCNSTAVDVLDGQYKCTDCGFEWEIVKFE